MSISSARTSSVSRAPSAKPASDCQSLYGGPSRRQRDHRSPSPGVAASRLSRVSREHSNCSQRHVSASYIDRLRRTDHAPRTRGDGGYALSAGREQADGPLRVTLVLRPPRSSDETRWRPRRRSTPRERVPSARTLLTRRGLDRRSAAPAEASRLRARSELRLTPRTTRRRVPIGLRGRARRRPRRRVGCGKRSLGQPVVDVGRADPPD